MIICNHYKLQIMRVITDNLYIVNYRIFTN